jgi:hypothetical protein
VDTEVNEGQLRRQRVADQGGGRLGQHGLAAGRDGSQPGGTVHIQADQAVGRPARLTGVDSDPDPDLLAGRPVVRGHVLLDLRRGQHAGAR